MNQTKPNEGVTDFSHPPPRESSLPDHRGVTVLVQLQVLLFVEKSEGHGPEKPFSFLEVLKGL